MRSFLTFLTALASISLYGQVRVTSSDSIFGNVEKETQVGRLQIHTHYSLEQDHAVNDALFWSGRDPFHQPRNTTNYYGSGDLNVDGKVTRADADIVASIVAGNYPERAQADVDGDGHITQADVDLIISSLSGAILPGWWNQLTTREQRNSWIDKMLALDPTNTFPYTSSWVCGHYASELFIRFTGYRQGVKDAVYSLGQGVYNLPLYQVTVASQTYGHAINAILVGDDPLNPNDWRFIEPQLDEDAYAGNWNIPFGTDLMVGAPNTLSRGGHNANNYLVFKSTEAGIIYQESHSSLMLSREQNPQAAPFPAVTDMYQPRVVEGSDGWVVFEAQRNDLNRFGDVMFSTLDTYNHATRPLLKRDYHVKLLDAVRTPANRLMVLWSRRYQDWNNWDETNLYTSVFDVTTLKELATFPVGHVVESQRPVRGHLTYDNQGLLHVTWFEQNTTDKVSGLFHSKFDVSAQAWTEAVAVAAGTFGQLNMEHFYDIAAFHGGLMLVYGSENMTNQTYDENGNITSYMIEGYNLVSRMYLNGSWQPPIAVYQSEMFNAFQDVKVYVSDQQQAHVVGIFWRIWGSNYSNLVYSSTSDGYNWVDTQLVNPPTNTNFASSMDVITDASGTAYIAAVEGAVTEYMNHFSEASKLQVYRKEGSRFAPLGNFGQPNRLYKDVNLSRHINGAILGMWTDMRADLIENQLVTVKGAD